MAFTLTAGYSWTAGDLVTAARLNTLPTVATNQSYLFADGTAAAPSIGFNSDSDNGFYYVAANTFGIAAGGASIGTFTVTGLNGCAIGATTPATIAGTTITGSSSITSTSSTGGIGYATGAGGSVVQATSKSTAVTLNTVTGWITMDAATLNSGTAVSFTVNNSTVNVGDTVVVSIYSGGVAGSYLVSTGSVLPGSFSITLYNCSGGNLGETVQLSYAIIRAINS